VHEFATFNEVVEFERGSELPLDPLVSTDAIPRPIGNGPKSPRIGDGCIGRVHLATQTGCVVYTGSQFLLFTTPHDLVVTANIAPCTMIDRLLK
jgi:hypothetical protein